MQEEQFSKGIEKDRESANENYPVYEVHPEPAHHEKMSMDVEDE